MLKIIIRGGPLDGEYEISPVETSVIPSAPDFPWMLYSLFVDASIGSMQRTASPQKFEAMKAGDTSQWGMHDYRLVKRTQDLMEVEYLGPGSKEIPLNERFKED